LPNWFVRQRGLAMGIAFAGVGIGSIILFPWIGHVIAQSGCAPPASRSAF